MTSIQVRSGFLKSSLLLPAFLPNRKNKQKQPSLPVTYLSVQEELQDLPKTALAVEVPIAAMAAQSGIFIADTAPG